MPYRDPESAKRYRARRRAELNAACRQWHAANREIANARSRAYYAANRERQLAAARARYAANPELVKAYVKAYTAANPHVKQAAHARRRTAEKRDGLMSAANVKALRQSADGLCAYCLKPCAKLVVEHCIPLSRGGSNTIDNCVMACASCNHRKSDKTPLEFLCNLPRLGRFDGNHPIQSD